MDYVIVIVKKKKMVFCFGFPKYLKNEHSYFDKPYKKPLYSKHRENVIKKKKKNIIKKKCKELTPSMCQRRTQTKLSSLY